DPLRRRAPRRRLTARRNGLLRRRAGAADLHPLARRGRGALRQGRFPGLLPVGHRLRCRWRPGPAAAPPAGRARPRPRRRQHAVAAPRPDAPHQRHVGRGPIRRRGGEGGLCAGAPAFGPRQRGADAGGVGRSAALRL
ncbi:MAG: hypothetical protein AVDCRST_MAG04-238, partial [uncultured Acetobacteraceae bacterium]